MHAKSVIHGWFIKFLGWGLGKEKIEATAVEKDRTDLEDHLDPDHPFEFDLGGSG